MQRELGRPAEALGAYEEAFRLYEGIGVVLGQANVMRGRGDLYVGAGDYEAARTAYGAALEYYTAATNDRGRAYAVWGLGQVAERGESAPGMARGYYRRAAEMFEDLGLRDEASGARAALTRVTGAETELRL